ncbi:mitochondrial export translocase Oxa2 [Aspergillus heteromorphus CBS 117.55]|uniref:Mitochondrial export translocase Oxa2 n=1 Tax=Aspergillus heteromorphus CBS 117.55 TaxID=1448321 RepID=A0A317VTQ8_9EURO|nr:mitochondrial export translocase Oxa2 [Aspergillus heteromorphus CBS 117.55]PWY76238.1 mitochondrial export translocase Oxa2 [Aspergillus heteromorphus CBS 117.55]
MRPFRLSPTFRKPATFHQVRHFHPTRPSPFLNEALELSSTFIHSVHSISGLPWALSIPLTAVIVRMTVAMPFQLYSKMQAHRENEVQPLQVSWAKHYRNKVYEEKTGKLPTDNVSLQPRERMQVLTLVRQKKKAISRHMGIPRFWRVANFLQIPVWISVMEGLRAMSGNNRGLVPWLLSCMEPAAQAGETPLRLMVEPSLATEGALWFPDLLAGDPTGILPIVLTGSILLNIRCGWKVPPLKDLAHLPKIEMYKKFFTRGIRLFIQILALNVGVSSYLWEMPAALMIYWTTSTTMATLQTLFLDRVLFPTKPLKPWVRQYLSYRSPTKQTKLKP